MLPKFSTLLINEEQAYQVSVQTDPYFEKQ
jgi:hypothetical protein